MVAEKDMITMSRKESRTLHIIHQALNKKITQAEAAAIIELSDRQVRRLIKRVRVEGDEGICHRSRGKPSNHEFSKEIKRRVIQLFRERYSDFGPTLAAEKLSDEHKIALSDETLRLWLRKENIAYKRRKTRPHRQWRERKKHFGEMIQIDGSHHDWFERRGPKCVLMGYIDDATGNVFGRFYDYEGTLPAMDSFLRYIKRYGIPQSVYLDKHSTYKAPSEPSLEDELAGRRPMSHFEKSLAALAVRVIHANSPQAKGRVERLFRTLQDRLIKEMRLAGISTVEQANSFLGTYLSKFNRKFKKKAGAATDLHRPAPCLKDLNRLLCIKKDHGVRNDFTIVHDGKLYQLKERVNAKKITVEERIDGSMHIIYKEREVRYQPITTRPLKDIPESQKILKKKGCTPAADHPWRRRFKRPRVRDRFAVAL